MLTLPQSARIIIDTLKKNNFEGFAVGGSVRDLLMSRQTSGWDFATNATPTQLLEIFPGSFYDNNFGTVGIPIKENGETMDVFEITTYRSEIGYSDKRRPDKVSWGTSIYEDLKRRDFTINAIAYDGAQIVDPYHGQSDIKNQLIRAVGNPNERFSEDALRLMRAVRIASQLRFTIETETFSAIKQNSNLLKNISADRLRHELMKILVTDYPADGIMLLRNAALLPQILPELEAAFGISQISPKRHHIYDVGTHLVMSLHHCPSKNALVRLATLLHDIGKPKVFKKDPKTGIITFYNHEVVGANIVAQISRRLNFSKKDQDKLVTLVRWHQFTVDENQTDKTLRRFIRRVGKENLNDIIDLRIGDRLGGGALETSWRLRLFLKRLEEVQKQPFTISDIKVNGHDVMKLCNLPPSPKVGQILQLLFDEVVLGKIKNERAKLLKQLTAIFEKMEK